MKAQLKKQLLLLIVGMMIATGAQAQHAAKILKSYKGESETMMFSIPGFAAKWVGNAQDMDEEYKQVIKKVKGIKMFIAEESDPKLQANMTKDFNRLFKKYDYKPLVQVKSDGDVVNLQFLPATKKHKGELVILVDGEDEFVALIVEGKFTEKDAKELAKNLSVN